MTTEPKTRPDEDDEMARLDRWANEDGIEDRERGYRLFENAHDRIVNLYNTNQDIELAKVIMDMDKAFFLVFKEKTVTL